MPNHFHLILKQLTDNGVSRFVSNVSNGHAKYFNAKHRRVGPLYQGPFKAVRVETDEQLLHLTRYVHLNPVTAFLIEPKDLENYSWSSLGEYLGKKNKGICTVELVRNFFKNNDDYRKFVFDQVDYARELEKIKHLTFEEGKRE